MNFLAFFTYFYLHLIVCVSIKVSFFGNGYIDMPLQEAKMSTNIRMKFRTQQSNGLIFAAGGRTDYCLLQLEAGIIKLTYKIHQNITEMSSPISMKLNDLNWHEVSVQRFDRNLTLQINKMFIKKTLPRNMNELSIHYGTLLGGVGEFSVNYLKNIPNFRGCMSDVFYNNINILKRAKDKSSYVVSKYVEWTCSNQFSASVHDSISFIENDAFAVMSMHPPNQNNTEIQIQFEIRTIQENAMIFLSRKVDFISIEIINKSLKAQIYQNGKLHEINSESVVVSDGSWHQIFFKLNSFHVEMNIDHNKNKIYLTDDSNSSNLTTTTVLSFNDQLYFGGLSNELIQKLPIELENFEKNTNLNGCIRNIYINNEQIGFPNISISQNTEMSCLWEYPCIEKSPCIVSASCHQHSFKDFICKCDQAYCIKSDFFDSYKVLSVPDRSEVLHILPMNLREGDSIYLNTKYINVLFNFTQFHIKDSSLVFNIIHSSKHGFISKLLTNESVASVVSDTQKPCSNFTYHELKTDKIKYTHNGDEFFKDHITIDFLLQNTPKNITIFKKFKLRFMIYINIIPVNDPPILKISNSSSLHIVQGVRKLITAQILNVEDPDSPSSVLLFTITYSHHYGRFTSNNNVVNQFSQLQIDNGEIGFLYDGVQNYTDLFPITFQVSDGIETSASSNIDIIANPIEFKMIHNTGLIMVHKSSAIITSLNLTISSNANESDTDIRYDIKKLPSFGMIEKFRTIDSSWIQTDWFTNQQLYLRFIRYTHLKDYPLQDDFKFTATLGVSSTRMFDFRITFTRLKIVNQNLREILIQGNRKANVTSQYFLYQTSPIPTMPRNIIYHIDKTTKYGNIFVDGNSRHAKEMDSFTQYDIDMNLIKYMTHRTSYSHFTDYLEFTVVVSECDKVNGKLKIVYIPDEYSINSLVYQNQTELHVYEGERVELRNDHFEIRFNHFKNLNFIITDPPFHGSICLYDEKLNKYISGTEFTLQRMYLGEVYYCHDNSESEHDIVGLLIYSIDEADMQYTCNITVNVTLINDNAPHSMIEKTFHVVRGETKIVSKNDIHYIDDDINTNPRSIIFTHVSCNNGEFYLNNRTTNQFSQEDITLRKVQFIHTGPDNGSTFFIVVDGKHEISETLDVQASDPYVLVLPNSGLIVQEEKCIQINENYFKIETNMDVQSIDIKYQLLEAPLHGLLAFIECLEMEDLESKNLPNILMRNSSRISEFTHSEIERQPLIYWNTDIATIEKLRYRVSIKKESAEGEIVLRIFPSIYWDPLKVAQNNILYVEESTSKLITKEILQVTHHNVSPGDITYIVKSSPIYGYLEIQSMRADDDYNCKIFDQISINSEKIFYIQASVNQSRDFIIFDVTNGVTWLRDLKLEIVIIPEYFYMEGTTLNVTEGGTSKIHPLKFQAHSDYYKTRILEYKIVEQPKYGSVLAGDYKINRFSQKQLDNGNIFYVNDGSDQLSDSITLIAITRNKESLPFVMNITITPVNDQPPHIVINQPIEVWSGGRYFFTPTDLLTEDDDTLPEFLTYFIEYIHGGSLFSQNLNSQVWSFSQSQINNNDIYFSHDHQAKQNEIEFYVNDGLFNTTSSIITIIVKPIHIFLNHNTKLELFPLTKKQITNQLLNYKCSDNWKMVIFNVTRLPKIGRLLFYDSITRTVSNITEFSQEMIDNNQIYYENSIFLSEFRANDSFLFNAVCDFTYLHHQIFNIEISVSSGGLLEYITIQPIEIDEGDSAFIELDLRKMCDYLEKRTGINHVELYVLISQHPINGLILNGEDVQSFHKIYPIDFIKKKIKYVHDHSDTLVDQIEMLIYLEQGNVMLCNLTIPIKINQINDQPFYLITRSPKIRLVEGEETIITKDILCTKDDDTIPDQIVYELITSPAFGSFMNLSNTRQQNLRSFTQLDINNNYILYYHNGSPKSTSLKFSVSDGYHESIYDTFNIIITPVFLQKTQNVFEIKLMQGSFVVFIGFPNTVFNTNAKLSRIMYNITNSPESGIILSNNQPTLHFTHQQLENNEIIYMQTDVNKSHDSFEITANLLNSTIYGISFNSTVIVEPIFKINPLKIFSWESYLLTIPDDKFIEQKFGRHNPKFVITQLPITGNLIRITKTLDNYTRKDIPPIKSFKLNDLKTGTIHFMPDENTKHDDIDPIDFFEYLLLIRAAQPARHKVWIEYKMKRHIPSENEIDNIYCMIGAAIAFVIVVLVLMLFCRRRQFRQKIHDSVCKEIPPPALPQPPNIPSSKNNSRLDFKCVRSSSVPTPHPGITNIPNYKIISVENDTDYHEMCLNDKDPNSSNCYYDKTVHTNQDQNNISLDSDNWSSSYEIGHAMDSSAILSTSSKTNPLLRRNQYWV